MMTIVCGQSTWLQASAGHASAPLFSSRKCNAGAVRSLCGAAHRACACSGERCLLRGRGAARGGIAGRGRAATRLGIFSNTKHTYVQARGRGPRVHPRKDHYRLYLSRVECGCRSHAPLAPSGGLAMPMAPGHVAVSTPTLLKREKPWCDRAYGMNLSH